MAMLCSMHGMMYWVGKDGTAQDFPYRAWPFAWELAAPKTGGMTSSDVHTSMSHDHVSIASTYRHRQYSVLFFCIGRPSLQRKDWLIESSNGAAPRVKYQFLIGFLFWTIVPCSHSSFCMIHRLANGLESWSFSDITPMCSAWGRWLASSSTCWNLVLL